MCFGNTQHGDSPPPSGAPDATTPAGGASTPCICCTVTAVRLEVSKLTLTLKHDAQSDLAIVVEPANATVSAARIEIQRQGTADWLTLHAGQALAPWHARVAGRFKLRGQVEVCGTTHTTPTRDVEVKFPTYDQIVANATLRGLLDAVWADTLADCTGAPVNQRRERGAWIRLDTRNDTYVLSTVVLGSFNGPTAGAAVSLPARLADDPAAPAANAAGATYSVASFHTHTPTEFRAAALPPGSVRPIGPSAGDNSADTTDNVPGVVYDFVESPAGSGSIPMGHPKASAAQLYKSLGTDPRPTP